METMGRLRVAAVALACVVVAGGPLRSREANRPVELRAQAYDAVYNLDYDRAVDLFRQAVAADPSDPASYRGIAKTAWLRILFQLGAITTDQYLGKMADSDLKVPAPPEPFASEFHKNMDKAIALAEKAVARSPQSVGAHYELGACLGYLSSYTGTIEGRIFAAMRSARRAYAEHERVLELNPQRHDADLVIGTYRYLVSGLPLPARWVAYIVGFGGGKDAGIKQLQQAAAYPSDAQTDARIALLLIFNRDGRFDEALALVHDLERTYPRNRLLWLEEGGVLLRAKRFAEAEATLTLAIEKMRADPRPHMAGEGTMVFYKRGAARLALFRLPEAGQDLTEALADRTGPAWVKGRIHLELGKAADLAGDRARARSEYQAAIGLASQSNDPRCAERAKRFLDSPYRQ
jgi:tetratricopeptide (TPR) repeat protein